MYLNVLKIQCLVISSLCKWVYFTKCLRKTNNPHRNILTTIISEGSRTMHSQPRLKLPAERLPKLEGSKANIQWGQSQELEKHELRSEANPPDTQKLNPTALGTARGGAASATNDTQRQGTPSDRGHPATGEHSHSSVSVGFSLFGKFQHNFSS